MHFLSTITQSAISWCRISCTYFCLLWPKLNSTAMTSLPHIIHQGPYGHCYVQPLVRYMDWTSLFTIVVKDASRIS